MRAGLVFCSEERDSRGVLLKVLHGRGAGVVCWAGHWAGWLVGWWPYQGAVLLHALLFDS